MKKLLTILFLLAFISCQEQNCFAPEPVMFDILYYNNNEVNLMNDIELDANGMQSLVDTELSIYYKENSSKNFVEYWISPRRDTTDLFGIFNSIIYSDNLIALTGNGNKEFYFELDNKIDTLFFEVDRQPHPECEGFVYKVLDVKFNGLPVTIATDVFDGEEYYYLESNKH